MLSEIISTFSDKIFFYRKGVLKKKIPNHSLLNYLFYVCELSRLNPCQTTTLYFKLSNDLKNIYHCKHM